MQAGGAARRGVGAIPGRGRLNALLAVAASALMVWVVSLTTSGVGVEDAAPRAGAGSAVVHDDAGNLKPR